MIIEQIKNSFITYNENHDIHIREYYLYCVELIKKRLNNYDNNINIIFGDYKVVFPNKNKTIKIDIQCEHTLVKEGGRSISNLIFGNVKHNNGYYLIRIDRYDYYNSLDVVIEYSLPNLFNIKSKDELKNYYLKNIYISPNLYNINFDNHNKTDVITLFNKNGNYRRNIILTELEKLGLPNKIIENCFTSQCLYDLYKKTKIIVNVHQTDHHHTFEELRVLPALLNGVIIVSENVPLKEQIPYSEYIIWVEHDKLAEKTLEVYNNYLEFYNKIFVQGDLKEILINMEINNSNVFTKIIK
jgi:hypothetical protein